MGLFTDGFKELKKASEPLYKSPKSIQETIEIMAVAENGIFEVARNRYSKCYLFQDINYTTTNEDEQIDACNRMIKGCQDQIDWVLYVNHQFIDITCTFKDKEGSVERCLSAFVGVMKRFADRLDALLLTYGIDLMRLQRESGLYLKQYRKITDVDVYIGSMELAQMYIDALPKEPQPEQTKDGMIKIDKETLSQLDSPQAKELLQRLVDKGFCTSDYKWNTEKTIYQATLVAHHISIILWGSNKWKPFEELWKFKNMAQTFNRSTTDANQDSLREVDDLFPENKPQK